MNSTRIFVEERFLIGKEFLVTVKLSEKNFYHGVITTPEGLQAGIRNGRFRPDVARNVVIVTEEVICH